MSLIVIMARTQEQVQTAATAAAAEDADFSATFCIFFCCTEVVYNKR